MNQWDEYYMNIAMAVREKANCLGRKVGTVIVKENRVILKSRPFNN
jgi:dCMP deaminase